MVTLPSLVTISFFFSQANSTESGSTSKLIESDIVQITSCICPMVFWLKPLGCKEMSKSEATQIETHL